MLENNKIPILHDDEIMNKIFFIRNQKVMLDNDLAALYGVETKVLKQQVKRNIERFPPDFMFELTEDEFNNLRSQFVTSSWGGSRYLPMVFTEQGVAMLSSVLRSRLAIKVNIQIMRIFTRIRAKVLDNLDLKNEIDGIKKMLFKHDENIIIIFKLLDELLNKNVGSEPRVKIGYILPDKDE